jgi:hypothetical protein
MSDRAMGRLLLSDSLLCDEVEMEKIANAFLKNNVWRALLLHGPGRQFVSGNFGCIDASAAAARVHAGRGRSSVIDLAIGQRRRSDKAKDAWQSHAMNFEMIFNIYFSLPRRSGLWQTAIS